jgi:hypothetical protein
LWPRSSTRWWSSATATAVKDFYDLYVLARQFPFDGARLTSAVAATFGRRRTPISAALPAVLAPRFYADDARAAQWRAYLTRNAHPGAPGDFAAVGEVLQLFLGPPWQALADRRAFSHGWSPAGTWASPAAMLPQGRSPRDPGTPQAARRAPAEPQALRVEGGLARAATRHDREAGPRRYKAYPTYKDSGVEWLGEIPAHWEVKRLKTLASVQLSNVDKKSVEGQESVRLCNYTDVYYNERITSDIEFMSATATREQVQRFSLRAGDVLITKDSESWTDIAVPAVVTEDMREVLCGYHLAHVRPADGYVGAFLSRAFAAVGPRDQFQVAANGITRFGLGGDAIRTGLFAVPPEPEQRAIAAFLDRETARIDALVAKVREAIERLKELRTALISAAVTGRIDVREEVAT